MLFLWDKENSFPQECERSRLSNYRVRWSVARGMQLLHINHFRNGPYTFSNQKVVAIPEVTSLRKKLLSKQDVIPQVDGYISFQSPGVWQRLCNARELPFVSLVSYKNTGLEPYNMRRYYPLEHRWLPLFMNCDPWATGSTQVNVSSDIIPTNEHLRKIHLPMVL
jgi:hypothetical protein